MTEGVLIIVGTVIGQFALASWLAWRMVRAEVKADLDKLNKANEASKLVQTNHAEVLANHGQALKQIQQDRTKRALGG